MEQKKSRVKTFPQANNLDKIFNIINIEKQEDLLNDSTMMEILEVTTVRQISYYVSACNYLGLLEGRTFSNFGIKVRHLNIDNQVAIIASRIVSKPIFGQVFFSYLFSGVRLSLEEISELIILYYGNESISTSKRRASTVNSWIQWIINQISV